MDAGEHPEPEILPPRRKRRPRRKSSVAYLERDGSRPLPLEFDEQTRLLVRELASYGVPHADIARNILNPHTRLPISPDTLRKAFREELADGRSVGNVKLARSLFQQATGAPAEKSVVVDKDGKPVLADGKVIETVTRPEIRPNAGAAIFLAKNRLGMSDTGTQDNKARPNEDEAIQDQLRRLTPRQITQLRAILRRALGDGSGGGSPDPEEPRSLSVRSKP